MINGLQSTKAQEMPHAEYYIATNYYKMNWVHHITALMTDGQSPRAIYYIHTLADE